MGHGLSSVEAWFSTALDIFTFCPVLVGINCMLWLLMSSSLLTQLTGPFLTALWVVLVRLVGSGGRTLLTTVRFVFGSNWQLVLVSLGVGTGYPTGLSFQHGLLRCSLCPLVPVP